jgi:hypothetical protein
MTVAGDSTNWRTHVKVSTVRRWLLAEEKGSAPPEYFDHALRPMAAVTELIYLCESILDGRDPPRSRDRVSLQRDVKLAMSGIGKTFKQELQPDLRDYLRGQIAKLETLLHDADGVASLLDTSRQMLDRIGQPGCAIAVWRDLETALSNGTDLDACWLYLLHLRDVEVLIGHDWPKRSRELSAAILAGGFDSGEQLLTTPPDSSGQVAWFIFGNASMESDALRIGQVQFFSERIWPDHVTDENFFASRSELDYPKELTHEPLLQALRPNDPSLECVFARVELTGPRAAGRRNPYAQKRTAAAWARQLVSSVVDAATFSTGGSRWILLTGELVFHAVAEDEQQPLSGTAPFVDPARAEAMRSFRPPELEGTGDALESIQPELADRLADDDPAAAGAVREARWYRAARQAPDPAQRLVLHVRAFERSLPLHGSERWDGAVRRNFRELWAQDRFDNDLVILGHQTDWFLQMYAPDTLSQLQQWIEHQPRQRFSTNLAAVLAYAGEIETAMRPLPRNTWPEQRALRMVARMQENPRRAYDYLRALGGHFDVQLDRARRQRNAIVHGIRTNPDVVGTVDRFIARLAASVEAQNIYSAAVAEDREVALQRGRQARLEILERLKTGDPPASDILYRPDDPTG